jgi:hypothetical protein
MTLGSQQFHACTPNGLTWVPSRDALRDLHAVFIVGQKAATKLNIPNYIGTMLLRGRRHITPVAGAKKLHLLWWTTDPRTYTQQTMNAQWVVDFFKLGIEHSTLHDLRCIAFLEGSGDEKPDQTELVRQAQATDEQPLRDPKVIPHEGRVRVPEPTSEETNDQPGGLHAHCTF